MDAATRVRLVPVVEAYTGILDGGPGGLLTDPQWDAFYRSRIVAAGLPAPIAPHPWYVPAAELRAEAGLATLVRALLVNTERADDDGPGLLERLRDQATAAEALDEVPALPGGYLLATEDLCLALPNCCGDLANLDEWGEAARHTGSAPASLWIGHPWLLVTADGDEVTLIGPVDDPDDEATREPQIAVIRRDELTGAVAAASRTVVRFADELRTVCALLTAPHSATGLAEALLGARRAPFAGSG